MKIIGEARFPIKCGHHIFDFCGLVVGRLDTPIILLVYHFLKNMIFTLDPVKKLLTFPIVVPINILKPNPYSANPILINHQYRECSKTLSLQRESKNLTVPHELINEEFLAREPTPNDPSNDYLIGYHVQGVPKKGSNWSAKTTVLERNF